jgi:succinyl-CoA synthetase alpha subunit
MVSYGTKVVAGVRPGKGGEWALDGKVSIFDSVKAAVDATGANTSIIYVPASSAVDAIFEQADARIPLIVCITERIPIQDMMKVSAYLNMRKIRLVGPNCPGLLSAGECLVGIIPDNIALPGNIGIVSRSGTLTYEVLYALKRVGKGVSTCVGIGGDPINGTNFVDCLSMFENDPQTDSVVLIGEIGGRDEEDAADYVARGMKKPVAAFIAGATAPPGRRMGHAGAIIDSGSCSVADKIEALCKAGVRVASHPEEIPHLL